MNVNENIALLVVGQFNNDIKLRDDQNTSIALLESLWHKHAYTLLYFTTSEGNTTENIDTHKQHSDLEVFGCMMRQAHLDHSFSRLLVVGTITPTLYIALRQFALTASVLLYKVSDAVVWLMDDDMLSSEGMIKEVTTQQILTLFKCIKD